MTGLVTDSNAQVPRALADRFGVVVVPLTVTVDGAPFDEGADLDADGFFALFAPGRAPAVTTAAPGPGRFVEAYSRLAEAGATEIVSVHIGSEVSATVGSARLAAASAPVPVHVVDTGTASFGVALCVWAAGEALAAGAGAGEAADAAREAAAGVGNVFVVKALDLARAGGRLAPGTGDLAAALVPVMTMDGGVMRVVAEVPDGAGAAEAMVAHVAGMGSGARLRVGVGYGDPQMAALADEVSRRLRDLPTVAEVVGYRVGPSVGAHTGPGTVGVMFSPVAPAR